MSSPHSVSPEELSRLIDRHDSPTPDADADLSLVPGAIPDWLARTTEGSCELPSAPGIAICAEGHAWSEGIAPRLRQGDRRAENLEGGQTTITARAARLPPVEQLSAGMSPYDAFYRGCRDATEETRNRPSDKVPA